MSSRWFCNLQRVLTFAILQVKSVAEDQLLKYCICPNAPVIKSDVSMYNISGWKICAIENSNRQLSGLTLATSVSRCRIWRSFSCICRMRLWTLVGDSESDEIPSSVSHWKQTYELTKPAHDLTEYVQLIQYNNVCNSPRLISLGLKIFTLDVLCQIGLA